MKMSLSKSAERGEASHRKNKGARFKSLLAQHEQGEAERDTADCAMMSPAARPGGHHSPRRTSTSTFWTIVIAFMTSQLISLCDPLTTTSASTSPASTGLQSNNNRHGSLLSMALAGHAPPQHKRDQRGHHQAHQQQFYQHHHSTPLSSAANLIQNSWPASQARAGRQQQHLNGPLISQSASLLPPSESAAFQSHQQQQTLFQQIAPLSMYHHPQPASNEQAPLTSRSLQQHQQQASPGGANSQLQSSSAPPGFYEDSAGDSESQDASDGASSGASSTGGDQLISSGTQELGQEATPAAATQAEPQDQFQSARERCRELISLTLLSFKDLTPNERASEEIDCATLRGQIAAATGRASFQSSGSPPAQTKRRQPQQAEVIRQTSSLPVESPERPGDSSSTTTGAEFDASPSSPSQLAPDEFPLQPSPVDNSNSQARPLIPMNPAPRTSARGQMSFQSQSAQAARKQQLQPAVQSATSPSNPATPAHQEAAGSANSEPQQQFFASKWEPKNSYINQVQALLLQQQQQQQSHRAQEHQNMLHFYKQLAAVQRQHSQPQISPPATTTYASVSTVKATPSSTSTTTPSPPTTMATTFESMLETTTLPPTTTSTTTTTTTTARPNQPKIRVGAPPGKRGRKQRPRSTTTTTTTTTTQRPSTMADYADGSDVSTDYYEDYEDQSQQQTTTTTTTRRPRQKGRRRPTTPKPTTTTTTLSPGYQPRPDGRIIDYMADPNFPRELKGADLTNYPFYISVPEKIDFDCKGRHDGYYSNIDLHCQIYHHCAIGNRYDFLCPNYTLFDQTTFTCRFINTVDCEGSTKHYDKNNALYVEKDKEQPASSSTTSTTTTTTQAPLKLMSRRTGAIELGPEDKQAVTSGSSSAPAPLDRISALALVVQQQRQMRAGFAASGASGQWKQDTAVR